MSEANGDNFGDANEEMGLFEGDMRLTGDQLLALGMGREEETRMKRQEEEAGGGGEGEGEFFGDAIEDGLFEGDMRLTGDQLLALQRGTLETHGDLEGVTYSHIVSYFYQKFSGICQRAIRQCNHWDQLPLAEQHRQVHFNHHTFALTFTFNKGLNLHLG